MRAPTRAEAFASGSLAPILSLRRAAEPLRAAAETSKEVSAGARHRPEAELYL